MGKKILYLTFYFEPDLCAGSFRNSPLVRELAKQGGGDVEIVVITTSPNRYSTFSVQAPEFEKKDNLTIHRIPVPSHQSGMMDQIRSFYRYFKEVKQMVKNDKYDLVFASSSRLFTAFLGYTIARRNGTSLYLDIRDLFYDTLEDVLSNGVVKALVLPVIRFIEKLTFGYAKHINLISEGFKEYFVKYQQAEYSYFTNGIDEEFIEATTKRKYVEKNGSNFRTIVYAGNFGEGQGLDKIVPHAAKALGSFYRFILIGDGGAKQKLVEKVSELKLENVEFMSPLKRTDLMEIYNSADFLFVHLNNFKAFEKVLPSKLFELATFPKPLIAGVSGFAFEFVNKNIENSILFAPCDFQDMVQKLKSYEYINVNRTSFIECYRREKVNRKMAESILKLL